MSQQLNEHDIAARWAAWTVAHPDAEILQEPTTWLERLRSRIGRRVWSPEQIRKSLGLPVGYRVRLTSRGDVHVWLPKAEQ